MPLKQTNKHCRDKLSSVFLILTLAGPTCNTFHFPTILAFLSMYCGIFYLYASKYKNCILHIGILNLSKLNHDYDVKYNSNACSKYSTIGRNMPIPNTDSTLHNKYSRLVHWVHVRISACQSMIYQYSTPRTSPITLLISTPNLR